MLQNMNRRSVAFGDDLSRRAAILRFPVSMTSRRQPTNWLSRRQATYLLGVDEIPVLEAFFQAFYHPRASRVCLHPSETQDTETVGIAEVLLEVTTGPFVKLDGVQVLDDGSFLDKIIDSEKDGALLDRAVQLGLGTEFDGLYHSLQSIC